MGGGRGLVGPLLGGVLLGLGFGVLLADVSLARLCLLSLGGGLLLVLIRSLGLGPFFRCLRFGFFLLLGLLGVFGRLGLAVRLGGAVSHERDRGADLDGLSLAYEDLLDRPRRRRGDFGVDLVGRYLDEELVLIDGVALLLEPLGNRSLDD